MYNDIVNSVHPFKKLKPIKLSEDRLEKVVKLFVSKIQEIDKYIHVLYKEMNVSNIFTAENEAILNHNFHTITRNLNFVGKSVVYRRLITNKLNDLGFDKLVKQLNKDINEKQL